MMKTMCADNIRCGVEDGTIDPQRIFMPIEDAKELKRVIAANGADENAVARRLEIIGGHAKLVRILDRCWDRAASALAKI